MKKKAFTLVELLVVIGIIACIIAAIAGGLSNHQQSTQSVPQRIPTPSEVRDAPPLAESPNAFVTVEQLQAWTEKPAATAEEQQVRINLMVKEIRRLKQISQ